MSKYQPWKAFEQEIVRKLRVLGFDSKRNWSEQFNKASGADIIAKKDEDEMILQLKYGRNPSLRGAFSEALQAREDTRQHAIGVCRFSEEKDTLVVMSWKTFEGILKTHNVG